MSEYLRMSGLYWCLTAMDLLHRRCVRTSPSPTAIHRHPPPFITDASLNVITLTVPSTRTELRDCGQVSRCDGWGGRIEARHRWNCSWMLSHVLSTTSIHTPIIPIHKRHNRRRVPSPAPL
jgi:hypothetical protein